MQPPLWRREQAVTIMVVPHSGSRRLSCRLSVSLLEALGVALLSFFIGLVVFAVRFHALDATLQRQSAELALLRQTTVAQARQLTALQAQAADVQSQLAEVAKLDQKVRASLNLPPSPVTLPRIAADERIHTAAVDHPASASAVVSAALAPNPLSTPTPMQEALDQPVFGTGAADSLARLLGALKSALTEQTQSLKSLQSKVERDTFVARHTPSIWPVAGSVTSIFGWRRSPFGGGYEFHDGLDIAAPFGTPILATADGKVTFVGWGGATGRTVMVAHGLGYVTLYGHMTRYAVHEGEAVTRGQVLGYVGMTGRTTGPHVHYGVFKDGAALNPRQYLDLNLFPKVSIP